MLWDIRNDLVRAKKYKITEKPMYLKDHCVKLQKMKFDKDNKENYSINVNLFYTLY